MAAKKTKQTKITKKPTPPPSTVILEKSEQKQSHHTSMTKTAWIAIILGLIIISLIAVNKGLLVAAIVNNKPIFRFSVNKTLQSRYGTQTLENMITERLISDEAERAHISVSTAEVTAKENEILTSFGGNVTLDEVLNYQGMTKAEFDEQIRLQMLLTKIIGKDVTITDEQIDKYIKDNPSTLVATDSEGMKKEAKEALLAEQVSAKLQTWYAALKEKAKIYRFMK